METRPRIHGLGNGLGTTALVAGLWLFAGSLVASGLLKLESPAYPAGALMALGLPSDVRVAIVRIVGGLEITVVCVMLLSPRRRGVQAAFLMSGGLLVAHSVLTYFGVRECACFGSTPRSGVIAWACAGLGFLCSVALLCLEELKPGRRSRPVPGFLAAAAIACTAGALALHGSRRDPHADLAGILWQRFGSSDSVLCIVGSPMCPECKASLSAICAEPLPRSAYLAFVVRTGDVPGGESLADRVVTVAVHSDLWWELIDGAPPGFVFFRPGSRPQKLADWRQAFRR